MPQPKNLSPENFKVYTYASNDTNSEDTFIQRQQYDTLFTSGVELANFFDFWGPDRFYGRANVAGNTITVRPGFLKQLRHASDPNLFALNFVADAWRDFVDRIDTLSKEGILYNDGPYADPTAVKAWRSPLASYHDYMLTIINTSFVEEYLLVRKGRPVKSVQDFLTAFGEFCRDGIGFGGPITYSGFVESVYCSPLNTGLSIEISTEAHSEDFKKEEIFFYDANFPLVSKIATQYGFALDRNAPWRFCADLASPVMVEYMSGVPLTQGGAGAPFNNYVGECDEPVLVEPNMPDPYGYSQILGLRGLIRHAGRYGAYGDLFGTLYHSEKTITQTVFNAAYEETWTRDMELLTYYLIGFYNLYVEQNPYIIEYDRTYQQCSAPRNSVTPRTPAAPGVFSLYGTAFGPRWSLACYYYIRCLEKGYTKTPAEKRKDLQTVMNQYNFGEGSIPDRLREAFRFMQEKYIGPVRQEGMYTNRRNPDIINNEAIAASPTTY